MKIEFAEITKSFNRGSEMRRVLDQVSWSASPGEIFGILGPNGSGKTTMIRILLDLLKADSGTVRLNDGAITPRDEQFRHQVGYLPEERALYKSSKTEDVIRYFGLLKGMSAHEAKSRTRELIEQFDLTQYTKQICSTLSKGLGQRVQLACCMIHAPQLLILDEPFYGLDPVNTQVVRNMLHERRKQGCLVLLCTHQMKEVESLCDRIVMLSAGKVALLGEVQEIRGRFSKGEVLLDLASNPEGLSSISEITVTANGKKVRLAPNCGIHDLIEELGRAKREVNRIEKAFTPLEEIFVSVVNDAQNEHP